MKKKVFAYFIATFLPLAVVAQTYEPLAPLPGATGAVAPEAYIANFFRIGIGAAGLLAVVMLVVAGIEYIGGAGSPSARADAKGKIWNAIFGLILALVAWLILNAINPTLLNINL